MKLLILGALLLTGVVSEILVIDTNVSSHSFDIEQDVSVVLDSADARLGGQAAVYKVVENKCHKINQARDRVCSNRVCPN